MRRTHLRVSPTSRQPRCQYFGITETLHLTEDPDEVTCGNCELRMYRDAHPLRDERKSRTELERLRRWKAEALEVMLEWESVWIAAGRPGKLGQSKALAVRELFDKPDH